MRSRRIVAAALAAITITTLSTATAGAQPMAATADRQCGSSPVGSLRLDLTSDIENPAYLSPAPEARRVTGTATIPSAGIAALGAASVEGTVTVDLEISGTFSTRDSITLDLARTPVIAGQDIVANVVGYTGTGYFAYRGGTNYVDIANTHVTLRPRRADGVPTRPRQLTADCVRAEQPLTRWMEIRTEQIIAEILPAPTDLRVTSLGTDSLGLAWNRSTGLMGPASGYEVLLEDVSNQVLVGQDKLSTTVTGLQPDTIYWVRVRGIQFGGGRRSNPLHIRTAATQADFYYDTAGSARINGSSVALKGELDTHLDLATATHTSKLALAPTDVRGRNGAAHLEFTEAAPTTGALTGGVFTATTHQTVSVPRITVFGRVIDTPGCRTSKPVDIPLTSGAAFDPTVGGSLTGTFTVPDLTGCGRYTSLVNSLLAGRGNRAEIRVAPWA
ncbi:fibronectin type III domain-containing protein [Actinokineospora enzanensis]|uniref:fibronectin type III domain-containing protein n=1 Tax=Actinokineospora enzanensis TaxID=155975 RepID=UPI0003A84408|nr:fibronectin type III domain-containing protein [Actinokineospora enzanensis]